MALSNHQGQQQTRYHYDAFGKVIDDDLTENQYTFTGRQLDPESGLYHFHFRQYDPTSGVWTTPDPIGISGGMNVYTYAGNNPVNWRDFLGLAMSAGELGVGNPGSYGSENTPDSMYGSNGLGTGNDWGGGGGVFTTALDIVEKVWNLPNTIIGLAVGGLGHIVGEIGNALDFWDREPTRKIGYNSIQFLNNPFTQTATTFGNVTVYSGGIYDPDAKWSSGYSLGYEEMQHTFQAQVLGPFCFPSHIALGVSAMITSWQFNNEGWHSGVNILEYYPHTTNPSPWGGCE